MRGHSTVIALKNRGALVMAAVAAAMLPIGLAFADNGLIQRGEYLARAGDCVACHTAAGGKPFAGGSEMPTPFGAISVPNITPDIATGIGDWTDDEFYRAMHQGIGKDGELSLIHI